MAYDPRSKLHVLFGSQFDDDRHTWTYSLRDNAWRDMQPAEMPPTDKNDAVLTYDEGSRRVLAIIKITAGKDDDAKHRLETWSYDVAANLWSKRNPEREPDPTGNRARQLMFARQLGVALLENRPSNSKGPAEQQIWAYRSAEKPKADDLGAAQPSRKDPRAVGDVVVSVVDAHRVEIDWKPATKDASGVSYVVERAPVVVLSDDELKRLKSQTQPLESPSVGALRWVGNFERLTAEPIRELKFVDTKVDLVTPNTIGEKGTYERKFSEKEELDPAGRAYRHGVFAYRVRAVSADGIEGGPSPAVLTIPSSPQHVFAKEEGTTCHVKWQPNPERGIAGYRVYRMDGRFSKDLIPRLTEAPITETSLSDPEAGKVSRRYHVVAVDALGQEGFPSSPVWFEREWKSFYKPFTGEWHQ